MSRTLVLALLALSGAAAAQIVEDVTIGSGPDSPDGSYVNAVSLAERLATSDVRIEATRSIRLAEPVVLPTGTRRLTLASPTLHLDGSFRDPQTEGPIEGWAAEWDLRLMPWNPVRQTFLPEFAELNTVSFAFRDMDPSLPAAPIEVTLYQWEYPQGFVPVATRTRMLPDPLPGPGEPAQFVDFDFSGVTVGFWTSYAFGIMTASDRYAVTYGYYGYGEGRLEGPGLWQCESGECDLTFRIEPQSYGPLVDPERVLSAASTIHVGAAGSPVQAVDIATRNAPAPVLVSVSGEHPDDVLTVSDNVRLRLTSGSLRRVEVGPQGTFDWYGGRLVEDECCIQHLLSWQGTINIRGYGLQISRNDRWCWGTWEPAPSRITEFFYGCVRGQLADGTDVWSEHFQSSDGVVNFRHPDADDTPPVIEPGVSGTQGDFGWYRSPVSVTWTVTDGESAVTSTEGCEATSVVMDTLGTTFTCSATSEGGTTSRSVTIRKDANPPQIVITAPAGTYREHDQVIASYSCSDATSGLLGGCTGTLPVGAWVDTSTIHFGRSFGVVARDLAGNIAHASTIYSVLAPLPVITHTLTGPQGQNGWYVGNVVLSWTVTSHHATAWNCPTEVITNDTALSQYTCVAENSGGKVWQTANIRRDATPPNVTISTPNGGTYTQGESVAAVYACDDVTSGIEQCAGNVAAGSLLDTSAPGTRTIDVIARDRAGHTRTASASYTVMAPPPPAPTVMPTVAGTLGANGWYVGNVSLTWTVHSQLPITAQSGCGARTITSNTTPSGLTYTCSATNANGTTSEPVTVLRDARAPTPRATVTPGATNGWRRAAVTVTFTGTDAHSGVAGCSAPVVLPNEGASQSASGTCTDNAGNVSAPVTANVNIDLTLPVVDVITPADGAVYPLGSTVTAEYACADALSGLASCTAAVANGGTIDTSRVRTNVAFTVTGRDVAGNVTKVTRRYSVR